MSGGGSSGIVGTPLALPVDLQALRLPAGFVLDHRHRTGSTNADALASGAPAGLVVVADHQDAGRGRQGRTWRAPAGTGLLFSVLRRPPVPPARAWAWTFVAGISAWRAAAAWPDVWLKWPNDLYAGERKLGGLLSELECTGARLDVLVVGVGINLVAPAGGWPDDLVDRAVALSEIGPTPRRGAVLGAFLEAFADEEARLLRDGIPALLERAREAMEPLWGRRLRVEDGRGAWRGTAAGLDDTGALVVVDDRGASHAVFAADVHLGAL